METGYLYLQIIKCNGTQLWNPWQEDASSNSMLGDMETLLGRSKNKVWNLNRPQKPPVLYN